MTGELIKFEEAAHAIAHARTVDELKDIRDKAEAVRAYAKQAGLGLEVQNDAAVIRLRAERRAGEMLAEMEKQHGGHAAKARSQPATEVPPSLADLGVEKTQSSRWQAAASVPEDEFVAWVDENRTEGKEITGAGLRKLATKLFRDVRHADAGPLPDDTYRILYADPPWFYQQQVEGYGHTDKHYRTMKTPEIEAHPLPKMLPDSICWIWATSPKIEEGLSVLRAWGFIYKAMFVWDKVRHNYGHYNSVRHELLLLGTRGSCLPDVPTLFDSVQQIERTAEHSRKPERFREIIDTLYPPPEDGIDRIEMFRRGEAPTNWHIWGAEANV